METSAAYFAEQAAQCRWLAESIANPADPAVTALRQLADGRRYITREQAARAIGIGADVVSIQPEEPKK